MFLILFLAAVSCTVGNFGDIDPSGQGFHTGFQIFYEGNGASSGSPPVDSSLYRKGDTVTVSGITPALRGPEIQDSITQAFIEWNLEPDGTGTPYNPGDSFPNPGHDLYFFAQWTSGNDTIGKIGPAGGFVFYDTGPGLWTYMEARGDIITVTTWSNITDQAVGPGAESTAIGDGPDNTAAITGQPGHTGSAALYCLDRGTGGFDDWFLPTQNELISTDFFHVSGLGSFPEGIYFSSSEFDNENVWGYDFSAGMEINSLQKDQGYYVLPVRRF